MTQEEFNQLHKKKIKELLLLAQKKGFDKDDIIKPACIIGCSEQMHEHFGDTLMAMDKIIELCKKIDDGEIFLQEVLLLAGIE